MDLNIDGPPGDDFNILQSVPAYMTNQLKELDPASTDHMRCSVRFIVSGGTFGNRDTTGNKGGRLKKPLLRYALQLYLLCCPATSATAAATVTIDASDSLYRFDGWGTAICWWGNIVGGYSDKTRDTIIDLLFDTTDGLGLNIIRYNIGGGDAPSHNHMGTGKEMEGFKASASSGYDWTKDKNQRWVMQAVKQRVPPEMFIAEAFSNSPPYWMTNSGCASGAANSADNLKSGSYAEFAGYLTEVVKHFRDEWGVTFQTLEPFNEPMGDWWNANGGQEGCFFSRANQAKLIREVHVKLQEKGLSTKIAASDEAGYDDAVATYNSFDATTRSYLYQINTHGYSGSKRSDLRKLADRDGKKLWASEIDGSGAPAPFDKWKHDHNDIAPGLDIANRIIRDLRDLRPDGWIFWQAVESEQAQISLDKNWGCLHADFTGGEKFHVCKKYHAFRQFTQFIRPGSRMVACSNNDAVAFITPDNRRLVIVQRNAGASDISFNYKLEGVDVTYFSAMCYRTSSSENFQRLDDCPLADGVLSTSVKGQSVTTFCLELLPTGVAGYGRNEHFTQKGRSLHITGTDRRGVTLNTRLPEGTGVALFDLQGNSIGNGRSTGNRVPLNTTGKITARLVIAEVSTAAGTFFYSVPVIK